MKIKQQDLAILDLISNNNSEIKFANTKINLTLADYADNFIKSSREFLKKNIFLVSTPFANAAFSVRKTIMSPDLIESIVDVKGIFICKSEKHNDALSFIYEIKDSKNWTFMTVGGPNNVLLNLWFCNNGFDYEYVERMEDGIGFECEESKAHILLLLLFKKYAQVEVVHTKPDERKTEGGTNYKNLTKLPISFLDSKWFREIINSISFSVTGHFRFQACGEGFKDRKLIWVNSFQKEGYHRTAQIDKN